jgi:hypothetical protein
MNRKTGERKPGRKIKDESSNKNQLPRLMIALEEKS